MIQGKKSVVVLIVEDDREMRSLLCDEMYDLGVSIREAADGDEAFRLVLDTRPNLILTDLRMPAGGLDYISRLRTFAPGVPIVLLTAFGDSKTKADALAIGVEAYFDKPVRLGELKGAVRRLLGQGFQSSCEDGISTGGNSKMFLLRSGLPTPFTSEGPTPSKGTGGPRIACGVIVKE